MNYQTETDILANIPQYLQLLKVLYSSLSMIVLSSLAFHLPNEKSNSISKTNGLMLFLHQ